MIRRNCLAVLTVAVILLLTAAPAGASSGGGTPVPPDSTLFGKSYGEWAGLWWTWAFGIPADQSPLIDPTGANCAVAQSGPVWYLAGTFTVNTVQSDVVGTANRRCHIPSGKYIFIPVFNAECSTVEGNGNTYPELLACATGLLDPAQNVTVEWDGAPVQGFALNSPFRVQSPPMTFTLPENNILGLPAGPSLFASDNYVVIMTPPKLGSHTVHVHGEAPINADSKFILDVTYHLVIVP